MIYVDLKPPLIDLEEEYNSTGRKQAVAVQRERLSEGGLRECIRCRNVLDVKLFFYNSAKKKTHNICKPCKLGRLQEHRQKMRALVNRWKTIKGCSQCGFKGHHFQLDLDHIDPETKRNKGTGNHRSYEPSWNKERIKEELSKCVILCANCHRLKTYLSKDHLQVCDSPAPDENCI